MKWCRFAQLAAAGALAVCATRAPARAQSSPGRAPSLSWVRLPGAEGCPSAVELARAVEQRLGERVFVPASSASLSVEARVEPARPSGFVATLVVSDAAGRVLGARELRTKADDCQRLMQPLAFVISVTLDADAEGVGVVDDAALPPATLRVLERFLAEDPSATDDATLLAQRVDAPEPEARTRDRPPSTREPPARDRELPRLLSEARVHYGGAGLPDAGPGLEAASVLQLSAWWRFELSLRYWFERSRHTEEGGGRFEAWGGDLRWCPSWFGDSKITLESCLGAGAGAIRASGEGFEPNQRATGLLTHLAAALRLRVSFSTVFSVSLGADLLAFVVRERFVYLTADDREEAVFRVPAIAGGGNLGVGMHFF